MGEHLEPLEILGMQVPLDENMACMVLRSSETSSIYAITLQPHQIRTLESASCRCNIGPMAPEAIAAAAGVQLQSLVLRLREGSRPDAELVLDGDGGRMRAVTVDTIDGLSLALRLRLPLFLAASTERMAAEAGPELPAPIAAFLEMLNVSEV